MIWEGEEPSTTGVKCGCWFDGIWIIFDGTNVFLLGCHLWVPGESPSDQRQPLL